MTTGVMQRIGAVPTVGSLDIAATAMRGDLDRLRSIANNLANSTTVGFKREVSVTRPFEALMRMSGPETAIPALTMPTTLPSEATALDTSVGALRNTGRSLDVALVGAGYLEVETESGLGYTRRGELHLDRMGRLVTDAGYAVMGDRGEILANGPAPVTIADNGDVSQSGKVLGRVKVVRFVDPNALLPRGAGVYMQGGARIDDYTVPEEESQFRSGHLEESNVGAVKEMVRMTETVRHFEALQRLIQGYDDALDKAIRKLGDL